VVIMGIGFLGGDGEQRCLEGGRGGSDGGPEGGSAADPGGVEVGFPPCPAMGAGGLGDMQRLSCSSCCLISGIVGTAGGLCCLDIGGWFSRSGLPSAGGEWADGALVLVGRRGFSMRVVPLVPEGLLVTEFWPRCAGFPSLLPGVGFPGRPPGSGAPPPISPRFPESQPGVGSGPCWLLPETPGSHSPELAGWLDIFVAR